MTATACTDTLEEAVLPKPLSVAVNARDITARAPIHGTALPDASSIGISLLAEDGTAYDGVTYANLKYTASGTAPDQTWSTPNIPTLSSTSAKLVAYYPWADGTDYTAVPVETDTQTDYMYSKWLTGLSNANPNASIVMQHALTAVRVALVKGDFTADVNVSSVSVKSPAFATTGSLDATTGALSGLTGTGEAVTVTADFPLTAQATNVEVMAVPDVSVAADVTTVTTQIGGRKYSVNINFTESYKQGYIYTYTLTLNNTGMEVTSVAVTPWQEGTTGSGTLDVLYDKYIVKITTTANDYTFTHNLVDFVGDIDWGDGTTSTYDTPTSWPTHIYTTAGEYTVTAMGAATALNNYDYEETAFTELVYIGEKFGLTSMEFAFAYAENLQKIHSGALDGCTKVTIFREAFSFCTALPEIPEGLFDKCTEVTSFRCTYFECSKLTNIPAGLFDKNTKVIDFAGTFGNCYNLNSIPDGIFDNCSEVTTFSQVFVNCYNIRFIPEGLFDKCTEVTDFNGIFSGCTKLTGIPPGLFDKNTKVTNFNSTFNSCSKINKIPEGLFDKCTKVTKFSWTFANTNITEIPEGLLDSFTEIQKFEYTFNGCTGLTNIPTGLFDNNPEVTVFDNTFRSCKNLVSIPTGLFDKNTKVTNFTQTFAFCSTLTSIPTGLFDKCTEVTTFEGTFQACAGLTGESPYTTISVDGNDVKVHLYERANYSEHFTAPTSYKKCFYNCSKLIDWSAIVAAGWN